MNKLYSVHDHWTDINKKNDVDIESIDGVITGIKVNGEDYGGGESDFSTAEVTYRLTFEALEEEETGVRFTPPVAIANNEITIGSSFIPVGDIPQGSTSVDIKCSTPLYKNKTTALVAILAMATGTSNYVYQGGPITATGNATITGAAIANITGDCVITIPVKLRY